MKRTSGNSRRPRHAGDPLAAYGFLQLARIAAEFGEQGHSPLLSGWLERAEPILIRLREQGPPSGRKAAGQVLFALRQAKALFIAGDH